jgi:hypothetical protein
MNLKRCSLKLKKKCSSTLQFLEENKLKWNLSNLRQNGDLGEVATPNDTWNVSWRVRNRRAGAIFPERPFQ